EDVPLLSPEYQQKLNDFYGNPKQKWKLIYKAARDGFKPEDFHKLCDNKGPTMSLLQSAKGGYLFGGFTRQSWTSVLGCKNDSEAFMFTLKNPYEIPPTKLPIKNYTIKCAVFHRKTEGPSFGAGDLISSPDSNLKIVSHVFFPRAYVDTTDKDVELFTGIVQGATK
ncbi:unnamed protein product, partial [Didymodactylos carnosus]